MSQLIVITVSVHREARVNKHRFLPGSLSVFYSNSLVEVLQNFNQAERQEHRDNTNTGCMSVAENLYSMSERTELIPVETREGIKYLSYTM